MSSNTKVTTGRVRLVYPALFEKRAYEGKEQYSVLVLVPKSDKETKAKLDAALRAAAEARFGANVKFGALKNSLRDGDVEDKGEAFEGHWFFNCASSQNRPRVVDAKRNDVLDPEAVGSGDWGKVSVNAFAWEHRTGGRGVSLGLNNVQWLAKGDPIGGGRSRVEDDFDEEDDWSDTPETIEVDAFL